MCLTLQHVDQLKVRQTNSTQAGHLSAFTIRAQHTVKESRTLMCRYDTTSPLCAILNVCVLLCYFYVPYFYLFTACWPLLRFSMRLHLKAELQALRGQTALGLLCLCIKSDQEKQPGPFKMLNVSLF